MNIIIRCIINYVDPSLRMYELASKQLAGQDNINYISLPFNTAATNSLPLTLFNHDAIFAHLSLEYFTGIII